VWDADDTPPELCGTVPQVVGEFAGIKIVADPSMKANELELRPGAVNYVFTKDRIRRFVDDAKTENGFADIEATSLVEFAEFKGYRLGPWMKRQLQEIDEAGARGLPHKG
jgi:hypothetical protein